MPRYSTKRKPLAKQKKSLLPLWLMLSGLALILIAVWAIMSSSAQTKANIEVNGEPRLRVDKTVIDHGDVKLGTLIRDDIRVTNVGDQPLRFAEVPYIEVLEGC